MFTRILVLSSALVAFGCAESDDVTPPGSGDEGGSGGSVAQGSGGNAPYDPGSGGGGSEDNCQEVQIGAAQLKGVLRDFTDAHPDFEGPLAKMGFDPGIVTSVLGSDGLPVYAGAPDTLSTNGKAPFDQWYRDVSGVNQAIPFELTLAEGSDGVYRYDHTSFFPADGAGFGNQGRPHNYHFTLELHTQFLYEGGEVFTFRGDDDLFVYINDRLAIDIGGVHTPLEGTVNLDAAAGALGISPGNVYDLDFFFAERHTELSHFHIETTIGTFVDCSDPAGTSETH